MKYHCLCKAKKIVRLILDGGPEGDYELDLCKECKSSTELRFVKSEIRLT